MRCKGWRRHENRRLVAGDPPTAQGRNTTTQHTADRRDPTRWRMLPADAAVCGVAWDRAGGQLDRKPSSDPARPSPIIPMLFLALLLFLLLLLLFASPLPPRTRPEAESAHGVGTAERANTRDEGLVDSENQPGTSSETSTSLISSVGHPALFCPHPITKEVRDCRNRIHLGATS